MMEFSINIQRMRSNLSEVETNIHHGMKLVDRLEEISDSLSNIEDEAFRLLSKSLSADVEAIRIQLKKGKILNDALYEIVEIYEGTEEKVDAYEDTPITTIDSLQSFTIPKSLEGMDDNSIHFVY